MDGLVKNSKDEEKYFENQIQIIKDASNRLAQRTVFHDHGWKLITPLVKLFQKYGEHIDNLKLHATSVYHPHHKQNPADMSFDDAINGGHVIVVPVFSKLVSSV